MRKSSLALLLTIVTLFPVSGDAGVPDGQVATVSSAERLQGINPNQRPYRGYFLDLSGIAGRQNAASITEGLRHQIDIVEAVGLSPRVLNFFHTVPIVVDELACLPQDDPKMLASACYGLARSTLSQRTSHLVGTHWDNEKHQWANPDPVDFAEDTGLGVVMVRPVMMGGEEPLLLHELLHAFHAHVLPQGAKNPTLLLHYNAAKSQQLYPADAYLLSNEREFFAVTASVFLYGKADKEPFTRANIKQKQPDYYKFLVWLFGFDPDRGPGAAPVAVN